MPTAAHYSYPSRPVDDVIPYVRKGYELAGELSTREVFAQALEMAAKGGGFATLVSGMENYTLVETGGGQIKVTDLGKRVVFETDLALLNQAKGEAVSRVELFRDYFAQYKNDVSEEKVRLFLRKSGVDVALIPKIAVPVGKLLKDNLRYMTDVHVEGATQQAGTGPSVETTSRPTAPTGGDKETMIPINDNMIEFRIGAVYQRFPMSEIETANEIIPALLRKKLKVAQTASSAEKRNEENE